MMQYLYQVTICWGLFYLLYAVWLRKETFFETNRWYLLGTLVLGLLIPLLEFDFPLSTNTTQAFQPANYLETITVTAQAFESNFETIVITPVNESWSAQFILLTIYWIGVLFFAGRFLLGITQIIRLRLRGKAIRKTGYTLIRTDEVHLPFSFLDFLFWSDKVEFNAEDSKKVLRHELCHIKGGHSVDVLITELISIVFWCSPLVFFYRRAIKNIHEYLADRAVLQDTPTRTYGQLLLQQSQSGLQIAQANNFIHSQLKNRILMMTKTKSQRSAMLKYSAILPILLLLVFSISARNNLVELAHPNNDLTTASDLTLDTIPPTANLIVAGDEVFQVVEEMPRFPGCEEKPAEERKACADEKMLYHIYTNIKYPQTARKAGIQGTAIAKFIIEKDGSISNINIMRSLSTEIDDEVKRVISSMPNFIPGKQRGKNVRVQYILPVKFKLEGDDIAEDKKQTNTSEILTLDGDKPLYIVNGKEVTSIKHINPDDITTIEVVKGEKAFEQYGEKGKNGVVVVTTVEEKVTVIGFAQKEKTVPPAPKNECEGEILKVVEQMPIFPGAEDTPTGNRKMLEFIYQNLKYPKEAKDNGIEGTAVANFVITKEGRITNIKLIRTIGGGTDEEVLRVMELMREMPENWTPGYQSGKAVNVEFNLPIKFKLTDDQAQQAAPGSEANTPQPTQELPFESVNIYPNPTTSTINADLKVSNNLPTTVLVTDINGKQIYKQEFDDSNIKINDLDLKDAATGIVLISFLQNDKVVLTKEVSLQR